VDPRNRLGRPRVTGMGLADGIPRPKLMSMEVVLVLNSNCCPIERLSRPLAVAVEPMSVAVSKAETLSRPMSGRDSMSRVDSHSAVEGLSGPLAVAGMELSPLLVRSGSTRVRLADSVAGGQLMSVHIVTVLQGGGEGDVGNSVTNSVSDGRIGASLAVAGVELSPLLERSRSTRVGLADGVAGGQLMSVHVVKVLQGGGEGNSIANSISDGRIGAPLADAVAVGSVDGGSGEESGGRPGGETGAAVVIS